MEISRLILNPNWTKVGMSMVHQGKLKEYPANPMEVVKTTRQCVGKAE